MTKILQKLEVFFNFIQNTFYQKKMVIFVGRKGIKISAYHKNNVIDSTFFTSSSQEASNLYQSFLKKYKEFQVFLLLDTEDCQLKHEFIPMFQSIIKTHPVEQFIEDNYKTDDIIAYNVYNIDRTNGEVWETAIASSPYRDDINQLLEFIIYNSFKLDGIYFLCLEFESIIDKILEQKNLIKHENDLQIFTTITEASGIRVAAKFKKNILNESTTDFPFDKSDLYVVGTIEQIISDIILKYKGYVKSLDIKISLIFVCNEVLSNLLSQSKSFVDYTFVSYHSISLQKALGKETTSEDMSDASAISPEIDTPPLEAQNDEMPPPTNNLSPNQYQDDIILELCTKSKQYVALNKLLRSISRLTMINSFIFKPIFVLILGIIAILGSLKYNAIAIQQETIKLNKEYYSLSEKYRNIKKRNPDVTNMTDLADFYNLGVILNSTHPNPCETLQKIFSTENPKMEVTNILWYAKSSDLGEKKEMLTFRFLYTNDKKDLRLAQTTINNYVKQVKGMFNEYNVTYIHQNDEITELVKNLVIPARIIVSRKEDD